MTIRSRDRKAAIKAANEMRGLSLDADWRKRNYDIKPQKTREELLETRARAAADPTLPEWARPARPRY